MRRDVGAARRGGQGGAVLVAVLLIAGLLTAIVTEFVYRVSLDISRVRNVEAAREASLLAQSGVVAAATLARQNVTRHEYSYPGRIAFPLPEPFPGREGSIVLEIEDENGKIDLNTIVGDGIKEIRGRAMLGALLHHLGLDADLLKALLDYVDADRVSRGGKWNAEPKAKNRALWSEEELKSVPGFTPEVFDIVRSYVTVYNVGNLINLNAAELPVLQAMMFKVSAGQTEAEPAFDEGQVENIIREREERPLTAGDWNGRVGFPTETLQLTANEVGVKGQVFRVRSTGQVGEVRRIIEAVVDTGSELKILSWREY